MDGFGENVAGDLGPSERMKMAAGAHQRERPPEVHTRLGQGAGTVDRRPGLERQWRN